MGVPMMCLMTADNQRGVATYLESHRLAESLGNQAQFPAAHSLEQIRAFLRDDSRRAWMSEAARKVVDGQGSKRVIDALINYPLTLRRATPSDARLLWEWVNDPVVRLSAFDTASIQWEQHQEWLARRLQDSNTSIWIGLDEKGVPIGQVRFELNNETATVDTSIAASQRGKGHAPKLLRLAVSALFDEPGRLCAKAWIKPGNLASQHAFTSAGFRRTGEETMHGGTAIGYCLKKS